MPRPLVLFRFLPSSASASSPSASESISASASAAGILRFRVPSARRLGHTPAWKSGRVQPGVPHTLRFPCEIPASFPRAAASCLTTVSISAATSTLTTSSLTATSAAATVSSTSGSASAAGCASSGWLAVGGVAFGAAAAASSSFSSELELELDSFRSFAFAMSATPRLPKKVSLFIRCSPFVSMFPTPYGGPPRASRRCPAPASSSWR